MIKNDVSNLKSAFYLLQKDITAISESACSGDSFFICLDNNCLAGQEITRFYGTLFSSSDNLIYDSAGVKKQAGQGGSTARAHPTFPLRFKNIIVTRKTAVSFKQWSKV
jgi:hypothetical protein